MNLDDLLKILKQNVTIEVTLKIRLEDEVSHSVIAVCKYCGWEKPYPNESAAKRGLNGHLTHCSKYAEYISDDAELPSWITQMHTRNNDGYQED